jgi:hypothetical protein
MTSIDFAVYLIIWYFSIALLRYCQRDRMDYEEEKE